MPPPPPPPPPGAPHTVQIPDAVPEATPLPFKFDKTAATSPSGDVLGADSRSLLLNNERMYPVSGEVGSAVASRLSSMPAQAWTIPSSGPSPCRCIRWLGHIVVAWDQ